MSERHPMIYNEFDIEAARKAGHEDERNRIIALLENIATGQKKVIEFNPNRGDNDLREAACSTIYQAIALIKGEQK